MMFVLLLVALTSPFWTWLWLPAGGCNDTPAGVESAVVAATAAVSFDIGEVKADDAGAIGATGTAGRSSNTNILPANRDEDDDNGDCAAGAVVTEGVAAASPSPAATMPDCDAVVEEAIDTVSCSRPACPASMYRWMPPRSWYTCKRSSRTHARVHRRMGVG